MRWTRATSVVVVVLTCSTAAAAARHGTQGATNAAPQSARSRAVTMVGCIQPGDPGGAPSGASGGSASSGSTSDPASASPTTPAYVLATAKGKIPLDDVPLESHVGQQVRVTGILSSAAAESKPPRGSYGSGSASTAAPDNTGAPRTTGTSGRAASPRLRVQSMRVLSPNCPQS